MDNEALLHSITVKYTEAREIINARRGIRSGPIPMHELPPLASSSHAEPPSTLSEEDQKAVNEILESTLSRAEALPQNITKAMKSVSSAIFGFHDSINSMWNEPLLPLPLPPRAGADERKTALDELRAEMEPTALPKKKKVSKLDEAASSVLLEWVTANLENPYPTAKEKTELEQKTGLDQTQIANWLINYRQRKIKQSF
jgi:hypothetical protein